MASATYALFLAAMREKRQVVCVYQGQRRELCPILLGRTGLEEKALCFQCGGCSASSSIGSFCMIFGSQGHATGSGAPHAAASDATSSMRLRAPHARMRSSNISLLWRDARHERTLVLAL